jgi:flagellar protein FliO/FliZ
MFDPFGPDMPLAAKFFIAFAGVLALIGVTAWLVRRYSSDRLGGAARGRQPRLAVIDAATIDGRRRLVLIRRDNIEHLLMIGGPTDVVIEPNIVRAAGTREPARLATTPEPAMRVTPPPVESTWPPASEPTAPPPPRAYRPAATEEPWHAPEPGARARPSDSLTGLAAELSSKLAMPAEPAPPREREPQVPRTTAAPPMAPAAPVAPEPPAAAPQTDHNLAEMAQQLEAALRRAPAPESRPPVTDALAVPPKPPRPAARESKPRLEPKFEPPKFEQPKFEPPRYEFAKREPKFEPPKHEPDKFESRPEPKFEPKFEPKLEPKLEPKPEAPTALEKKLYDNLEEEMASLLGRPPDKP